MKHQHYLMLVLVCVVLLDAVTNGVLDSIDHHKGARDLLDFWHLVKYIDRALLISVGVFLFRFRWRWWYIPIAIACLLLFKELWNFVYYDYADLWVHLDDTIQITTGWPWLDALLGFAK